MGGAGHGDTAQLVARLRDIRRVGRHLPCPTTAGASLGMLARHVEGHCRFYGVLVETPDAGPRRLSLWEAGAAMGSVPLPWPNTAAPG